ncbi:MAG: hypothetical protein BWY04_00364 [candidate division CPR1 bacterium ADurb.Bin160]|uniref:Uncharacterized protein n=1 Tax=candidate division CPR1 bacterium ADurb.Bin160 TaxID=1852826 RepID=A0A1V5ZQH0_9BACT|nr:MAG: hypothetical protein BWY04_00364 [candidate division CPR1 bacterium ADurb.Bin160]
MNLIKSSLSKQGISLVKTRQESPDIKKRLASNGCWTVPTIGSKRKCHRNENYPAPNFSARGKMQREGVLLGLLLLSQTDCLKRGKP